MLAIQYRKTASNRVTPKPLRRPPGFPVTPRGGNSPLPKSFKRRKWLVWLLDLVILSLLLAVVQWWQTRGLTDIPAPPLQGWSSDGRALDLVQYRGKPVLVHFWAEWCPVCRAEESVIDSLSTAYPVLTVATQSGDAPTVSAYLRQKKLSFPTLLDPSGELARRWGVRGLPTSFIIDGAGRIRSASVGYSTGLGLRFRLRQAETTGMEERLAYEPGDR